MADKKTMVVNEASAEYSLSSMDLCPHGYKQTEAGVIPEDWDVSTIGSNTIWLSGGTPNRSIAEFWRGTIPWISGSTLKSSEIFTSDQFLTKEAVAAGSKMAPLNSTLLLVRGSALHSEIRAGLVVVPVSFNQDVKALIPNRSVEPKYLTFYILGWNDELLSLVSSAGNSAGVLDTALVQNFKFLKPPMEEQKSIAKALSDVDELIDSLEKLIAKKRDIKTATMQQLLTGKKRLQGFGQGKGYKQTELGEIPEDWDVLPISDYVWYQEGPGVRKHQFTTRGVKLLNGTNIEKGKLKLEKTERHISTDEAYGQYSHFLVNDGDILIACSGVEIYKFDEKVTLAQEENLPLCMNTSTMRFKVNTNKMSKLFFMNYLKSSTFKSQIGGTATGSAQLNFGPYHVDRAKMIFPQDIKEQIAIAKILTDMDKEIAIFDSKYDKTKAIKQGMMQELLTGRTRLIKPAAQRKHGTHA